MKLEKNLVCLWGALFGTVLSFCAVGCMVTGLALDVPEMGTVLGICALSAAVSALACRFRWGQIVLLCLLVPVTWAVCRDEHTVSQSLHLLYKIVRRLHTAYGWSIPGFLQAHRAVQPLLRAVSLIGALTAMEVSLSVCLRGKTWAGLLAAAVPFGVCFLVTDTVPETPFLLGWLLCVTLLILTDGVRRESPLQGIRLCAMAVIPTAAALGLLFWAAPREGYDKQPKQLEQRIVNWLQEIPQLWEEVSDQVAEGLSGSVQPSQVSLRALGPRLRKIYPVMEVTAAEGGTLYLRGQDYDLYDGTGWSATQRRTEVFTRQGELTEMGKVTVVTRRTRDVLYLPYYPGDQVTLIGGQADNQEDLREYTYARYALPDNWEQQVEHTLREEEEAFPETLIAHVPAGGSASYEMRYLNLPLGTKEWAERLLAEILPEESTATEKARAIAGYVKNTARYDLNTPRMPREWEDFVQWFVEESETGYCVHFATAATVLLRAAGVEARYVEGYMLQAQPGTSVTVTEDQAHAWTEYYEPMLDMWLVLEATPPDLTEPETQPPVPEGTQKPAEPEETMPGTASTVPAKPEDTAPDPSETEDEKQTGGSQKKGTWLWWSLLPGALLALAEGQRRLRLGLRHAWGKSGDTNSRALDRWRELERLYRILREEPPREAEQLAEKAKYSSHMLTPDELEQLEEEIRQALIRLQRRPWQEKLIHKYIFAAY